MTDPIIEAMCLAAIPKIMALEPDVRARDMTDEELAMILKAAYLEALPMIVEQCAQVAESAYMTDDYDVTAQRIRAHAAAKVEELSRGQ
jgi:hypothetical protein